MAKKISKSRSKIIKNAISIPKEKIKILRKEKPKIFSIFETINQWLKENCEDCPPTIVHDYCVSGHKNKVTEAKITGFLNHLFSQKLTSYKVGKTCQAETRITKKDYKGV